MVQRPTGGSATAVRLRNKPTIHDLMNKTNNNEIVIGIDKITARFGEAEPIVIPRASLRTRLQLIAWVYRLTCWPGMNLPRLRAFITALFKHHGWSLPDSSDDSLLGQTSIGSRQSGSGQRRQRAIVR